MIMTIIAIAAILAQVVRNSWSVGSVFTLRGFVWESGLRLACGSREVWDCCARQNATLRPQQAIGVADAFREGEDGSADRA